MLGSSTIRQMALSHTRRLRRRGRDRPVPVQPGRFDRRRNPQRRQRIAAGIGGRRRTRSLIRFVRPVGASSALRAAVIGVARIGAVVEVVADVGWLGLAEACAFGCGGRCRPRRTAESRG